MLQPETLLVTAYPVPRDVGLNAVPRDVGLKVNLNQRMILQRMILLVAAALVVVVTRAVRA